MFDYYSFERTTSFFSNFFRRRHDLISVLNVQDHGSKQRFSVFLLEMNIETWKIVSMEGKEVFLREFTKKKGPEYGNIEDDLFCHDCNVSIIF